MSMSVDHQNGITKSFQNHIKHMTKVLKSDIIMQGNDRGIRVLCAKSGTNKTTNYLGIGDVS